MVCTAIVQIVFCIFVTNMRIKTSENLKPKLFTLLKRSVMTLLLAVVSATTAWADEWPEYITDVIVLTQLGKYPENTFIWDTRYVMNGYTIIEQDLNEGAPGPNIYLAYKKGSRASADGGYITDFIVLNTSNPPVTYMHLGKTYRLCPYDVESFQLDEKGNLNAGTYNTGWNLYLYYTKGNYDDKRVISDISFTYTEASASDCVDCFNPENDKLVEGGITAGDLPVKAIRMNFEDGEEGGTTGISPILSLNGGVWYDLSGRKIVNRQIVNCPRASIYITERKL